MDLPRRGDPTAGPPWPTQNASRIDAVEAALAKALELASQAGEWAVVAELGRQLEARRRERVAPEVTDLDAARRRRER